jgi:flagellar motor protein MotB
VADIRQVHEGLAALYLEFVSAVMVAFVVKWAVSTIDFGAGAITGPADGQKDDGNCHTK